MKTLMTVLFATLVAASSVQAAEPKIGLIDLRKVFDNYWKTRQADARLKETASQLDAERTAMRGDFTKIEENYKKLVDSASDPVISGEEKERRKKSAEGELLKLRELDGKVQQFDRQSRTRLAEEQRRMRDNILVEIKDVVKEKARNENFTLVLDVAAETRNETPVVLFSDGSNEITDGVLRQLNQNAPALPATTTPAPAPGKPDEKKP
jgi:outer membrane protein